MTKNLQLANLRQTFNLQKVLPLVLGWFSPALYSATVAIGSGLYMMVFIGVMCLTVTCIDMFILSGADTHTVRTGKLLAIPVLLEAAFIAFRVHRFLKFRKDHAVLEKDAETGELHFKFIGGDSYPAIDCENGEYRAETSDQGHFAIISEEPVGFLLTTSEGKKLFAPRHSKMVNLVPLVLGFCFEICIVIGSCIYQARGSLEELPFPVVAFPIAALLMALFLCHFFDQASFIVRKKQYPKCSNAILTGLVTGAALGWLFSHDLADSIIAAILMAGFHVVAGLLLERQQRKSRLIAPSPMPHI